MRGGDAFIAVRAVASLLFRGSVFVLRCASRLRFRFYVLGLGETLHAALGFLLERVDADDADLNPNQPSGH